jgi:hypothetical protein
MKIPKPNPLDLINVPKKICNHIVGKDHTLIHRITVGTLVMGVGVLVAKIETDIMIIHVFFDGLGYLLHGIGAIPIVEQIAQTSE